jgi:hypothetical protein
MWAKLGEQILYVFQDLVGFGSFSWSLAHCNLLRLLMYLKLQLHTNNRTTVFSAFDQLQI